MSRVAGKVCVVTGAASGIGRALAVELAERGASGIAISDVNEEGLAETAALLTGVKVDSAVLDVADREAFIAYAARVAEEFGVVHQIYNNAGVGDSGSIDELDYRRLDRIIGINLWGVIHGTKEFLPHLIASGDGHVTNVSSLNGILAQAEMSGYCTTKFGVRGFTESVALDMKAKRLPVGVSVVHPGGIKTEIANAALASAPEYGVEVTAEMEARNRLYNDRLLRMPPSKAAEIIVNGVESDRGRIMVGNDARMLDGLVRLLPSRWPAITGRLEKLLG